VAAKALIVGLGNPGRAYAGNRHNVGFQCLDRLAARHRLSFGRLQNGALIASGVIAGRRAVLAKPQGFMNLSGRPVGALLRFYQLTLDDLLVVYDDLDLPLGTLRLRPEGGAGGHNGMRSLIQHLGTQDFPRLRVGIGRPPGRMDPAAYVLQDFGRDEQAVLAEVYDQAQQALEHWLEHGLDAAMNRFNRKP
jgi:PTH1 family peptidyl-tRNA hydrolase